MAISKPATEFEQFSKIALPHILKAEGGFSNHPNDSGGATNQGVTQATYDLYLKVQGKPPKSVRHIAIKEVEDIYYEMYWVKAGCDQIPYPLNVAVFDWAVNAGVKRAIITLQQTLVMLGYTMVVDGIMGRNTLSAIPKAITKYGIAKIALEYYNKIRAYRALITIRNPKLNAFKQGWLNRDNNLLALVKSLA